MFSGAQLNETVPDTTDLARYSIDFRTVHLDDIIAGHARNLDSRCTGTTASGLLHLPKDVVALYDDDSASGDRMLYFGDRLVSEG